MQVPDDSLLVAELKETVRDKLRFKRVCFSYLPDTWRQLKAPKPEKVNFISRGELLAYLNPFPIEESQDDNVQEVSHQPSNRIQSKKRRVVDRKDLQLMIPGFPTEVA